MLGVYSNLYIRFSSLGKEAPSLKSNERAVQSREAYHINGHNLDKYIHTQYANTTQPGVEGSIGNQ